MDWASASTGMRTHANASWTAPRKAPAQAHPSCALAQAEREVAWLTV
jgi:hypothetical protein